MSPLENAAKVLNPVFATAGLAISASKSVLVALRLAIDRQKYAFFTTKMPL